MPWAVSGGVCQRHQLSQRHLEPRVLIQMAYSVGCFISPDCMLSELNHLVLCLRLHVLTITMSIFKGSPSPFQLSNKAADIHTAVCVYMDVYTHPDLFSGFPFQGFLFIHTSSTWSVLHMSHPCCIQLFILRAKWEMTPDILEERKLCAKKSSYWKEALEIKWLNYVPVGWCSRYICRRGKIKPQTC